VNLIITVKRSEASILWGEWRTLRHWNFRGGEEKIAWNSV